ncbi:MAG: TolC family protein [Cytophagales bacterium]|nr:MAG: TolC family protein [Cytophagales bacterium]
MQKVFLKKLLFSIGVLLFCINVVDAQDTLSKNLRLSYEEAKAILLRENLELIAAYYEVSKADAALIQAKLWRNPYFVWNQDLYSLEKNQFFNYRNQHLLQVEIVVPISGKYINSVRLGKLGIEQNRLIVYDIMRALLYDLGEHYFELQALQAKEKLYKEILIRYEKLIESAENKLRVGAISSNEVVRLESEYIAVQTESIHNQNDILTEMSSLRQLLNLQESIDIETLNKSLTDSIPLSEIDLINDALENRPDYRLNTSQIKYEEVNLKLEKANALPDVKFAYQPIDRGSNYVRPYEGLVIEFSLPIFDRNQGNIKLAKAKLEQSKVNQLQSANLIRNEVSQSYHQLLNSRQGLDNFSLAFLEKIETLNQNANQNYEKKNINLLEFIDLQRIYIENKLQYIDIINEYQKAINYLNFTVGKEILN